MSDMALDYREAISSMARTPDILGQLVLAFPGDLAQSRPAPDEWSAREIVAHMLWVEALLTDRVESMIATDAVPARHGSSDAAAGDRRELVGRWRATREATLQRLRRLSPDDLRHSGDVPRWGRITVEEQVCEWAYHDLEHLRQLLANEEALLYPGIGGFRKLYSPPYAADAAQTAS